MPDEKNTPSTPPAPKPAPKAPVAAAAPKPAPAPKAAESEPAAEKPQASPAPKADSDDIVISPERPAVVDMRFIIETIASGPEVVLNTFLKGIKRVIG